MAPHHAPLMSGRGAGQARTLWLNNQGAEKESSTSSTNSIVQRTPENHHRRALLGVGAGALGEQRGLEMAACGSSSAVAAQA